VGRLFYAMIEIANIKEATEVAINMYKNVDLRRNTQEDKIFFTSLGQVLNTIQQTLNNANDKNPPQP
jgi:fructose-specific phosphotransferase system component IIB